MHQAGHPGDVRGCSPTPTILHGCLQTPIGRGQRHPPYFPLITWIAFQAVRQLAIAPRPSANSDNASISTSSLPSYTTTPRSSFQSPRTSFQYASSPRSSFQYASPQADDIRALFAQQCSINDVLSNSPTIVARQLPTLEPPPKPHSPPAVTITHGTYGSVHRTNSDERIIAKFEVGRLSVDQPRSSPLIQVTSSNNMSTSHLNPASQAVGQQVYGAHSNNKRASCTAIDTLHQSKRLHWEHPFQLPLPMDHTSTGESTSRRSSYEMTNSSWMSLDALTGPMTPPSYILHGMHKTPQVVHEEDYPIIHM